MTACWKLCVKKLHGTNYGIIEVLWLRHVIECVWMTVGKRSFPTNEVKQQSTDCRGSGHERLLKSKKKVNRLLSSKHTERIR